MEGEGNVTGTFEFGIAVLSHDDEVIETTNYRMGARFKRYDTPFWLSNQFLWLAGPDGQWGFGWATGIGVGGAGAHGMWHVTPELRLWGGEKGEDNAVFVAELGIVAAAGLRF